MNERLRLYTVGGGLEIIYVKDFIPMIKTSIIEGGNKLHIPFQMNHKHSVSFDEDLFTAPKTSGIESRIFDFKKGHISIEEEALNRMRKYASSNFQTIGESLISVFEDDITAFNDFKKEELNIMVAQKNPEFFIKDLNLETIQKLSNEYYKRCYNGDCYGMHIDLSKYQKFFAIVNSEDFTFYRTKSTAIQEFNRDAISINYKARLINLRPDNWVVGRYENLTYLTEMNAMRRY